MYTYGRMKQVPIYVQFNGYPPHVDAGYQGRIRLVEQASIEISDLRTSDEGWYECSVVFLDETASDVSNDGTNNGSWIHLTVYCKPLVFSLFAVCRPTTSGGAEFAGPENGGPKKSKD